MRAKPPSLRISAGTRSSAITATAPASSEMRAWSASVTSMISPPLSISARPDLTLIVPVSAIAVILASACEPNDELVLDRRVELLRAAAGRREAADPHFRRAHVEAQEVLEERRVDPGRELGEVLVEGAAARQQADEGATHLRPAGRLVRSAAG